MTSLKEIEKIINSDLSTKIQKSSIENDELVKRQISFNSSQSYEISLFLQKS